MLDASAAVSLVLPSDARGDALRELMRVPEAEFSAPHLIDIEVWNALRRAARRPGLARVAGEAVAEFDLVAIRRYPHQPLRDRIWELAQNLTSYDACYVALAESLSYALVTSDGALARAPGVRCEVVLL